MNTRNGIVKNSQSGLFVETIPHLLRNLAKLDPKSGLDPTTHRDSLLQPQICMCAKKAEEYFLQTFLNGDSLTREYQLGMGAQLTGMQD